MIRKKKLFLNIYLLFTIVTTNLFALEFIQKKELIAVLNTQDNSSSKKSYKGNVIQGLTSFKNLWITTQTVGENFLIVNFLNINGVSIYNQRIKYSSHGQDLSLEYLEKENLVKLYTVSKDWKGIVSFNFKISQNNIKYLKSQNDIDLRCNHCTSTIDTFGKYFAVKDSKSITIYDKKLLFKKNKKEAIISKFKIDKRQIKKGQFFQGIVMRNNFIYTLTSSSKTNDIKYLFVYNLSGEIIHISELSVGKILAINEGTKYELEGLTFKENCLYTSVMSGKNGNNIKRLYKILEVKE